MNNYRTIPLLFILVLISGCSPAPAVQPPPTTAPLELSQSNGAITAAGLKPPAHPVYLPQGFQINIFADGIAGPKMMAFGPEGALYVTEFDTGRVLRLPDPDQNGAADSINVVAEGMIEPSGLAFFEDGSLYVAETTRVFRLSDPDQEGKYQEREIIISGIPAGGNTNRTIIFSPDWERLFLSIGSSCEACVEQDPRRGTILMMEPDGAEPQIYADGFRYIVGLAFHPDQDNLWGAVIERGGMDGGLPPGTVYTFYLDTHGGWPYCHAGEIPDPDIGNKDSCGEDIVGPRFRFEGNAAPHGLEFYTGSQFPAEYNNNLFIALHGTGEGDNAAGFKIIRKPLGGGEDNYMRDFAVGWLLEDGTPWGTPMDLIAGPDGSLYLSDDLAGIIYRISYSGD